MRWKQFDRDDHSNCEDVQTCNCYRFECEFRSFSQVKQIAMYENILDSSMK